MCGVLSHRLSCLLRPTPTTYPYCKYEVHFIVLLELRHCNECSLCLQGQPLGGPRIKHVCRAAAVALGQPRAMVPEDIPRLSALPLHEREGIAPSQDTEGTHISHSLH